jgi:type VI secretion system protein ImpM
MSDITGPGFYGKFPELGDFVNRRLPRSFLDPWDDWLQSAIATSREQLGDDWLDLYLTSPVWSFVLSGNLCGEAPWCGLLMPSVDRVGRYYPLIIATSLPLDVNPFYIAVHGTYWFDSASDVLLSALDEEGFDIEVFDSKVVALDSIHRSAESAAVSAQGGYGSSWRMPLDRDAEVGTVLPGLAHRLALQRLGDYSLWWTSGSQHVEQSLLLTAGMPPAHDFGALLAGKWQESGWEECLLPMTDIDAEDSSLAEGKVTL